VAFRVLTQNLIHNWGSVIERADFCVFQLDVDLGMKARASKMTGVC